MFHRWFTLVLIFLLASAVIPIPYYLEVPGSAENLKDFVKVNTKTDTYDGSFMLTTVGVVRARPLTAFLSLFFEDQELVSKKELMGSSNSEEYNKLQEYYMKSSENAAKQVALELAGKSYKMTYKGIYVMEVDEKSNFKNALEVGDTVYEVDNQAFKSSEEFMKYVKSKKVGDQVSIKYVRSGKKKEASGKLIRLDDKKAGIGIALVDNTAISTDQDISIDAGSIGGPSAGLMFTLETYSLLSQKDIRKGYNIAGTGTMSADGTVGRIGGIDKKIVAADKEGAEIFFAPDDEISADIKKEYPNLKTNYQEAVAKAKKIKTKMKIVPVKNVRDALDYLDKLKQK